MTNKVKFIKQVTKALGRSEIIPPEESYATAIFEDKSSASANAEQAVADAELLSASLLKEMAESSETAGWKIHRTEARRGSCRDPIRGPFSRQRNVGFSRIPCRARSFVGRFPRAS